MIIDYTFFSYGAGLVMLGWIVGMVYSQIINALNSGSRI